MTPTNAASGAGLLRRATAPPRLPYLHRNARSRQITSREIREVFEDEVARGFQPSRQMSREEYLRKVMP